MTGFMRVLTMDLPLSWVFLNRDSHPNEVAITQETLIGGLIARGEFLDREGNHEIVLNGFKNIINNSSGSDFAFVILRSH